MASSMTPLHSELSETSTVRSSRIHSRSWRSHSHGCDQSSRMTISVLDMDSGVSSGWMREPNDGDGFERR